MKIPILFLAKFLVLILTLLTGYVAQAESYNGPPKELSEGDNPENQSFHLPEGISFIDNEYSAHHCNTGTHKLVSGTSGLFKICQSFVNSSQDNIQVNFPAGLLFKSDKPGAADGIILQEISFDIEAFSTVHVQFYAFIFSRERLQSAGHENSYRPGSVTDHTGITELTKLISEIGLDDKPEPGIEADLRSWYLNITLQNAIHDVLVNKELCNSDKEIIKALR